MFQHLRHLSRALLFLSCAWTSTSPAWGQEVSPGSIQGRIRAEDGTPSPGVLVLLYRDGSDRVFRGAESDALGYYHLEPLPPGSYLAVVSRLGLGTETREFEVSSNQRLTADFSLRTAPLELEGISVEAERSRERVRFENEAGLTVQELTGSVIKGIPGLVEADPLRAVEVLPGVTTVSDFSSAFNVRGGSADQNLILLDGIPVFNPTHLGGFFSVFNADMIQRAELRSGGFPARFGGRVSSVLDIETDAGSGEFGGDAGVSLLATRLALEGSLPEGASEWAGLRRGRWRVSGRRSYFDQLLRGVMDFPYHLTDLQGFFEGWTEGGDRISVSAYSGRDVLDLTTLDPDDFPLRIDWDWGNTLIGGRWTRPREDGGWWEIRSGFSRFNSGLRFPDFDDTDIRTAIDQKTLEGDFEIRPSPYLSIGAGVGIRRLSFSNLFESGGTEFGAGDGKGSELFSYLQTDWTPSSSWIMEIGAR
ncbi:MAG: TonB-dependent receptor, partial [Gemmatimonadetes bacterium]|nr:TonB-dependent receptor [Gemmatimonadota bacterium]